MGQAGTLLRKALNLPDQAAAAPAQRRAAEPTEAAASTMAEAAIEAPAADRATPEGVGVAPVVTGIGAAVPWETEDETSGAVWLRRALRGLLVGVLILTSLVGLRQMIAPRTRTVPAPPSALDRFPREQADAVAARFAQNYLSWSEDTPDVRRRAMALDLAGGASGDLGWDGKGRQSAGSAQGGSVAVDADGTHARVTVLALVTPFTRQPDKTWTAAPASWRAVEVPVVAAADRVVVTGEPGLVALPAPGTAPAAPQVPEDTALSASTRRYAQAFFTAYAAGDVDALTAPRAVVSGLGGAVTLERVSSWQVQTGGPDQRQARAVLVWRDAKNGAVVEQSYTVDLTRVTGAGGDDWQVSGLHGGT